MTANKNKGTLSGVDCLAESTAVAPPPIDIIPVHDTVLNWASGDLDWTSGGPGAPASPSRSIGGVSGVDAISQFDGSE